jgi:PEP-CTERM motif
MKATLLTQVLRGKTAVITAMALAAMVTSASAQTVTNGNFDNITSGIGTSQELSNGTYVGSTLQGWTNGTGDYNFVFTHSNGPAPDSFSPPVGNEVTLKGSPQTGTSGNFVALDSDFPTLPDGTTINTHPFTGTITGLNIGDTYTVTFSDAADQQVGYGNGPYSENLTVTAGTTSKGFVLNYTDATAGDWTNGNTITFTADATTDVISFLANGAPTGIPSFVLLDNVSVTDLTTTQQSGPGTVPEPGSLALLSTGLIGLGSMVRSRFKK